MSPVWERWLGRGTSFTLGWKWPHKAAQLAEAPLVQSKWEFSRNRKKSTLPPDQEGGLSKDHSSCFPKGAGFLLSGTFLTPGSRFQSGQSPNHHCLCVDTTGRKEEGRARGALSLEPHDQRLETTTSSSLNRGRNGSRRPPSLLAGVYALHLNCHSRQVKV